MFFKKKAEFDAAKISGDILEIRENLKNLEVFISNRASSIEALSDTDRKYYDICTSCCEKLLKVNETLEIMLPPRDKKKGSRLQSELLVIIEKLYDLIPKCFEWVERIPEIPELCEKLDATLNEGLEV